MTYPIKQSALVPVQSSTSVTFTPPVDGWANVVCVMTGRFAAPPPPRTPAPSQPPGAHPEPVGDPVIQTLNATLELFAPGGSTPVFTKSATQILDRPTSTNHLILFGDAPISAAVGGVWTVKVINAGNVALTADVTVRYPTVAGNLGKIDHVVVLMMENRSFDHMLGHLSIDSGRGDVDGLKAGMSNPYQGQTYPVTRATSPSFRDDPNHGFTDVRQQLDGAAPKLEAAVVTGAGGAAAEQKTFRMDGFVANFAGKTRQYEPPEAVMRYNGVATVPVYAALADQYTVCDRWFASLPTDTWPNRLYSLCGTAAGMLQTPSGSDLKDHPPDFTMPTIFEALQQRGVDWNLFFDGIPFALVFKKLAQDAAYTARMRSLDELVSRAKTGDLPAVSWIDPAFSDIDSEIANDDHPPGNVTAGQILVAEIYQALSSSPAWSKTLFVITYDEHGGLYDHVPPPTDTRDGAAGLGSFGVRVPALVISPWGIARSVSKTEYDHTTLLRTILLRFCGGEPMTPRTDGAADLWPLLSGTAPRVDAHPIAPPVPTAAVASAPRDPNAFGQVLRQFVLGF